MTLISPFIFSLENKKKLRSPKIQLGEISIIIPVKDNQQGINDFLSSFFKTHDKVDFPREIIIIDNNSKTPIKIFEKFNLYGLKIILTSCIQKGPASARNRGVSISSGEWLLFIDSDCIATDSLIKGYLKTKIKAVGYAGMVKAKSNRLISKYYESQEILLPLKDPKKETPQYLITANCLIWKFAFNKIKGFNENITLAGGEDVDIGLRLSQIGNLSYCMEAIAIHNFENNVIDFWRRFVRYGKGNRLVEEIYNTNLSPKLFRPNKRSIVNEILAKIQWLALQKGYRKMSLEISAQKLNE